MDYSTFWWLIAGLLVALELVTGTFYLLMLALGMAAAALAGHGGLGVSVQIAVAAVVGLGAAVTLYLRRRQFSGTLSDADNLVNDLDAGQTVQINPEQLNSTGAAVVQYRGTGWPAMSASGSPLTPGPHRIVKVDGSRLLLEPI